VQACLGVLSVLFVGGVAMALLVPAVSLARVLAPAIAFLLVLSLVLGLNLVLVLLLNCYTGRHVTQTVSAYLIYAAAATIVVLLGTIISGETVGIISGDPGLFDATGWALAQHWQQTGTLLTAPEAGIQTHSRVLLPEDISMPIFYIYGVMYYLFGHQMLVVRFVSAGAASFIIPIVYLYARTVFDQNGAYWVSGWARVVPQFVIWGVTPNRVTLWTIAVLLGLIPVVAPFIRRLSRSEVILTGIAFACAVSYLYYSEQMLSYMLLGLVFCYGVFQRLRNTSQIRKLGSYTYDVAFSIHPLMSLGIVGAILITSPQWTSLLSGLIPAAPPRHGCAVPADLISVSCLYRFARAQLLIPNPWWFLKIQKLYTAIFTPAGVAWYASIPLFVFGSIKLAQQKGFFTPTLVITWALFAGNAIVWWVYSIGTLRYRMIAWPVLIVITLFGYTKLFHERPLCLTDRASFIVPASAILLVSVTYIVIA
jgi:hypothetical protein